MQRFLITFERHKPILKVASKNSKIVIFDFESGYESGYGFSRPLHNIKTGTFDIFHANTIKTHILVKFCGN